MNEARLESRIHAYRLPILAVETTAWALAGESMDSGRIGGF